MTFRRVTLLVAALALVTVPVVAFAAPLTSTQIYKPVGSYRFCAEAQLDIASIDESVMLSRGITVSTTIYGDFTPGLAIGDFVSSKSAVDHEGKRILTREAITWRDDAKTEPGTLRCKMRTGESIAKGAFPAGSPVGSGRFVVDPYYGFGTDGEGVSTGVDHDCSVVNQRTIDTVWASLTPEQQAAAPFTPEGASPTLVTAPDVQTPTGPDWLSTDTPSLAVTDGKLVAQSRALISPTTNTDVGPRFNGAHYCTFVAPQYLRDVLLGAPVENV